MNRRHRERLEAFLKRLREDVRADSVRERAEYVREFPELESEIDAELVGPGATLELHQRRDQDDTLRLTERSAEATLPRGSPDVTDREPRIGRYVLEKELGRGGQGQVYLARDPEIGLEVALKVLSSGQAMSTEARLRFKGEAEKVAKLNHPNIARVHEWGEDQGVPFIAMEFVRGETLAAHIRQSAFEVAASGDAADVHVSFEDWSAAGASAATESGEASLERSGPSSAGTVDRRAMVEIAELIESAARGLHEAHERGLVHRDVKPANLIIEPDRGLVILDFGLAHDDESEGPSLTMTGDVMGTPAYMSPEQLTGKRVSVDRRSDVYSLGVTLYECLALRRPFEAASREALFQEIIGRDAPDLRKSERRIPTDLAVIAHHAMQKHPDQRYSSALEMAEDLRRFRQHEPIVARPVGPITRTLRWARRKPATAGLLVTVFVALITIASITTLNSRRVSNLNESLSRTNTSLARTNAQLEKATREARERTEEAIASERLAQEETAAKTAALAREQKALADKTSALSEYERMADTRRLANARAEANAMWPVHPELIPLLQDWQRKYAPLFARLADHRAALEALRDQAQPYRSEVRRRDFAPELALLARLEENAKKGGKGVKTATGIEAKIAELRETIRGRRSWEFGEDVDLQFRHDILAKLVADLAAFTAESGSVAASVRRRLDRSQRIRKETLEDHHELWSDAIARIASHPRYGGLSLEPQLGLIPLGADRDSGLEEFLDWGTHDWSENDGALPERGDDGRIAMTEGRGLVFVLIPGGGFRMGAQRDREKPNFDPDASENESPVREVVLSAYLISKYEMTQGQWSRFDGVNPSNYPADWFNAAALEKPVDLRHPVEQVSWEDCTRRLGRQGLDLPTEAQWERAARAGVVPTTRWTGTSETTELARFANLSGREAKTFFSSYSPEHEDEFLIHAPVSSFTANAFGLFDTTGNVWEWCRDPAADYGSDPAPGDGLRRSDSIYRVIRGGGFNTSTVNARLACRLTFGSDFRNENLGVRPSRRITTD